MKVKRVIWVCIIIVAIVLIVAFPFLLEAVLFEENAPLFSKSIRLDRDDWFSFIGSYLGALGTIFLGGLAIWQNKRYKAQSNETENKFITLQTSIQNLVGTNNDLTKRSTELAETTSNLQSEIKELVLSNAELQKDIKEIVNHIPELIEKNTDSQGEIQKLLEANRTISDGLLKLQESVFYPRIDLDITAHISVNGDLYDYMDGAEFAYVFFDSDAYANSVAKDWKEVMRENCSVISFSLKNNGEKDVIDFSFEDMTYTNGERPFRTILTSSHPTIKKQQEIWVLLAVPREKYEGFVTNINNCRGLVLQYSLKNSLGDAFIKTIRISNSLAESDGSIYMLVHDKGTEKIDSLWEWQKEKTIEMNEPN